ncbi:hypothetical protein B8V81_0405 [Paenibacillus pasadenensis]|uniref:Uncharacterized protein n=1 Tax=Paenibacillus pasadenensis TaxID=217090 RepID=A0A2N5ND68_9BACL|nr:hypothetical protein B8V81_0405 [Paenibacillus pasadenensis]
MHVQHDLTSSASSEPSVPQRASPRQPHAMRGPGRIFGTACRMRKGMHEAQP